MVKKIKTALNTQFLLFISCHGLANVNDKKDPCVAEEGVFISEDTGVISMNNHVSLLEICHQSGLRFSPFRQYATPHRILACSAKHLPTEEDPEKETPQELGTHKEGKTTMVLSSTIISHPSANQARSCLASEIT